MRAHLLKSWRFILPHERNFLDSHCSPVFLFFFLKSSMCGGRVPANDSFILVYLKKNYYCCTTHSPTPNSVKLTKGDVLNEIFGNGLMFNATLEARLLFSLLLPFLCFRHSSVRSPSVGNPPEMHASRSCRSVDFSARNT